MERRKVIGYSGGLDSVIVGAMVPEAQKVYFNVKSRYSEAEIAHLPEDVIIDDTFDFSKLERDNAIIPFRNMYFANRLADYGDDIYMGVTEGDNSFDKDKTFFKLADLAINHMNDSWWGDGQEKRFLHPLKTETKAGSIALFLAQGGDPELLIKSFSCYTPVDGVQCGNCKPCIRKYGAMLINNIDAIESFAQNPIATQLWRDEIATDKRGRESLELQALDKSIHGL